MERAPELLVFALAFFASAWLVRSHPVALLTLLVAWFAAPQLVANVAWAATSDRGWSQALILWKEFAIAGAFVRTLPRLITDMRSRNRWVLIGALFGLVVIIWAAVVAMAQPIDQTLRGVRALAFPIVLALIGFASIDRERDVVRLRDNVVAIAALAGTFAVVEWALIPDSFWRSIDIRGYWI